MQSSKKIHYLNVNLFEVVINMCLVVKLCLVEHDYWHKLNIFYNLRTNELFRSYNLD